MKRILAALLLIPSLALGQVTTNPSVTGVPAPQSAVAITGGTISGVTLSASSVTDTGLTATRIPYISTGGLFADVANFTYTVGTSTVELPGPLIGPTTATVFNTGSTTVNAFGAASAALNVGNATGQNKFLGGVFGFGVAPETTQFARFEKDWGELGASDVRGVNNVSVASETTGATAAIVTGLYSDPRVGGSANAVTNTQNWTAPVGIAAFGSILRLNAGMSGTITGAAGFTVSDAVVSAGTLTTQYGLYVNDLTTGATNYAIYTGTGLIRFGGLGTGTNADTLCLSATGVVLIQAAACTISSLRFKTDVTNYQDSALDQIKKFEPIVFRMKAGAYSNRDANAGRLQIGLAAENVAAVDTRMAIYEDDGVTPKSYRQEAVIALLVKAIQEQQKQIEELRGAAADRLR